jgi:hypothetical protein
MPTRNSTNRLLARHGLGDDPRLLLRTPRPPPASAREDLEPPSPLDVSTMLSDHSKPNGETHTADSQKLPQDGRWEQHSAYHDSIIVGRRSLRHALCAKASNSRSTFPTAPPRSPEPP